MTHRELIAHDLLRRVEFFQTLDAAQLQRVSTLLHEHRIPAGTSIFNQGDLGECLYIIWTGYVRIYLLNTDGREITFRVYGSGAAFGEFAVLDGNPRSASAVALSDVVSFVIYREDFLALMRTNFDLVQNVLGVLTERLRFTTKVAENLAFLSASERIANALTQLVCRALPSPHGPQIKLTQHELASYAGATREWTNKALRTFAKEGLLKVERNTITIIDETRLAHWAAG